MARKKKTDVQEEVVEEQETTTALAVLEANALLPEDMDIESMSDNLSEFDDINFPRLRIENGKFKTHDDDPGSEELDAVILFFGKQNSYWSKPFSKTGPRIQPDCFAADGKTGSKKREGNKFGECRTCYFNQFKSHPANDGKACRNQYKLYLQVSGLAIPMTLILPPTAIKPFKDGFILHRITQKGLSYFKVLTRLSAYRNDDETFYRVNYDVAGIYRGDEASEVARIRDYWLPIIKQDRERLDFGDDIQTQSSEPTPDSDKSDILSGSDDDEDIPF